MLKNKKRVYRRLLNRPYRFLVILGALLIITAGACIYPLPPTQLFPPDGTVFGPDIRDTTLEWEPLIGAASYRVEVDCFGCCEPDTWCTDIGEEWRVKYSPDSTVIFDFGGALIARWRVSGLTADEQEGQRSGWWEFTLTE